MKLPFGRLWARPQPTPSASRNVLESYVASPPSPENAVDIFKGQWASQFPPPFDGLTGATAALFADDRISWAVEQLGGVRGMTVLELGPLEGGHSYMLDRAGARHILALEGNQQAYLRCLIAKELLGMPAVHFACGDFMAYLRASRDHFDLCVASGVLYHMQNPVELLQRISVVTDRVVLWTHYYDAELLGRNPTTTDRIVAPLQAEYAGFPHQLFRYEYGRALDWDGFCGGARPFAYWLLKQDILSALKFFGFTRFVVGFDQPDHVNGPAFALVARRGR